MTTAFVLVYSKARSRVLLAEEGPPAGRLGLIIVKNAAETSQVSVHLSAIFNTPLSTITPIGYCAGPDWGHVSSPVVNYSFYGLETNAQLDSSLESPPANHHWVNLSTALSQWQSAELRLAPPAPHFLDLLSRHGGISDTAAAVQCDGLHLRWFFAPSLELLPLPSHTIPPFTRTNTIFLRSKDDLLIVDPGSTDSSFPEFEKAIQGRAAGAKVTVLLTHHHGDHVHGLPCIERLCPDALVLCHPQTLSRVHTKLQCRAAATEILKVGDVQLRVIFTPGHTDGHLVLFEPKSATLIAGDHVVGIGSAVLDPECGDMAQYLHSTRVLLDLKPQVIYPAHGPPCLDGVQLLSTYITHREQREAAILASYKRGNTTAPQIVKDVYTDVPQAMHAFAVRNVELHLRKLQQEAKL